MEQRFPIHEGIPKHGVLRKFLAAWVSHPPHCGRLCMTLCCHMHVKSLKHILRDDFPDNGVLRAWICPYGTIKTSWETLSHNWIKCQQALTLYAHGNQLLLLGPGILNHEYDEYLRVILSEQMQQCIATEQVKVDCSHANPIFHQLLFPLTIAHDWTWVAFC